MLYYTTISIARIKGKNMVLFGDFIYSGFGVEIMVSSTKQVKNAIARSALTGVYTGYLIGFVYDSNIDLIINGKCDKVV